MYDFKTFAQMNLDFIFTGFDRMPQPGEEVFARSFTMQLGGGPQVYPIVLERLGLRVRLGTFLGESGTSAICRSLLEQQGFGGLEVFPSPRPDPEVVTSVFSWPDDRGFLSHNEGVNERCLDGGTVYRFLRDARAAFAPEGHPEVTRRLHEEGVKLVYDNGWSDDLSIDSFTDFLSYIDVYSPNDREALKLAGTGDLEEAVRFLARYTPHPVVTLGRGGAAWWEDGSIRFAPAVEEFAAVDTTGAGDNFLTGVIYGLLRNEPLARCVRLGNIFAGCSTTAVGCFGARITPEIIEKYL
ncbi:MAG: carbohydrate kinase family protein [Oscillibacter sp.]|jgi:ribokinase|nr:carbohydrate kinase family protein [Oscillibacter sp.]MCI9001773.1 carbohydrate kinase family protein [Oscillibacter sp.]